ncbi:MAG: tetratricopeptide repeat protein, partial [Thermodesulfobacteriota bacterium]|nr:tetratricopeptide repeat protein [Thermodesulfobacteriota bacterium]
LILPGGTGLDLLKKVKASKERRGLPFIIMSASKDQRLIIAVAKAGATSFMVKPFDPEALVQKMEASLQPKAPESSEEKALCDAGRKYAAQGKYPEAIAAFSQAIKQNSLSAEGYRGLAEVCKRREEMTKYKQLAQKAAQVYVELDNFQEAENVFLELRRYDKDAPNPFRIVGETLLKKKDFKSAAHAFQKAVVVTPDDPESFCRLSEAYMRMGEDEKAVENVEAALRLKEDFPDARKLYRGLTGKKWVAKDAEEKKGYGETEEEKRGTVRFWVPDLFVTIMGNKTNFQIHEMSVVSVGFNPQEEVFEEEKEIQLDIIRIEEGQVQPQIKKLAARIIRIDEEVVGCRFENLTEEVKEELHALIQAAQEHQQEQARERVKNMDFNIDMLFV